MSDSFPRLLARTMAFTLGVPKAATLSADGATVLYLRSRSGTDRTGLLWSLDVGSGDERLLADPGVLLAAGEEDLPPEERARRERLREGGAGVTAYATDEAGARAVFALSARLWVVDVASGEVRELPTAGPVIDPRLSPDGQWVAYVANGGLQLISWEGADARTLAAEPDAATVAWGLADFMASEELDRFRGHWWLPDSSGLLVERYDEAPVDLIHIADPANPQRVPQEHRYPAAGTPNAAVSLWRVDLDGSRTEIEWDHDALPYVSSVDTDREGHPLVTLLERRQRRQVVLDVGAGGGPAVVREIADPDWVDVVPGTPRWWGERLLTVEVSEDTYRLCADGSPLTPPGLQVRGVVDATDDVLLVGGEHPAEQRLWRLRASGELSALTPPRALGAGTVRGGTTLLRVEDRTSPAPRLTVAPRDGVEREVPVHQVDPGVTLRVVEVESGPEQRTIVLLPSTWAEADGPLPVLMEPYGGPHHARVVDHQRSLLEGQWVADQGFAVVVGDGPGTPGAPSWERACSGDLAAPALAGQVAALAAAAAALPGALDTSRVAIRGWSFGGYLSALAVLKRPDLFHAAVAGAPVTDMALYDTAYTERYLGLPQETPETYEASSLLPHAAGLERPLLIIHGLADDNVLAAHTLKLSGALLAAGRPHSVLPLTGVTHMTPDEVVRENLLLLQLDFVRRGLGIA